ncbi:DUF4350 domain-containing protein [Okeania sp. KiyG1]|uniref:DUF4350 domain-containing protein n=1 Tax=Okeania sp. KiyG1 TaxID=2720165 RepID=UPI0019224204|nr:DUF4350 domain-containing protein [Okeania sp. KiyG1]GGA55553.1 hypothetical protein CYANOKiyG1_76140 [Okeania sp. KiyG1]
MKKTNKFWIFGAIALISIMIITVFSAPVNNQLNSGSTYSRAPDGYGAWYKFMLEKGADIQRWEKPFIDLENSQYINSSVTLLQVNSKLKNPLINARIESWVKSGNILVILGIKKEVTKADFTTTHDTEVGKVEIETSRRAIKLEQQKEENLLGDRYGAIVWQKQFGKGRIILATTQYLAANAYQDIPGNYEFLAQLVTQGQQRILVDEYIHGYKDQEVIKEELGESLVNYLVETPLFPIFIQGLIILVILIFAQNRRFAKPIKLSAPIVDNSQAYIQALAGVLQKAESREFILETTGKEQKIQLQNKLGLGENIVEDKSLIDAWIQQTGEPSIELEKVLKIQSQKRKITESELLNWLDKWEKIFQVENKAKNNF